MGWRSVCGWGQWGGLGWANFTCQGRSFKRIFKTKADCDVPLVVQVGLARVDVKGCPCGVFLKNIRILLLLFVVMFFPALVK